MALKLTVAVLLELAYMIITRTWLRLRCEGIPRELWTTAFRLVNALVYWALFRGLIMGRPRNSRSLGHPLSLAALACLALVPALVSGSSIPGLTERLVYAATSLAVAVKEEFFFRGILQNILERRRGLVAAIVISNMLFIPYHYGAQLLNLSGCVELFTMGSLFGIVYAATGSIVSPIAIHAAYDALWCFTPMIARPVPHYWGNALIIAALALYVTWARRPAPGSRTAP